jgi:hypothetical protein
MRIARAITKNTSTRAMSGYQWVKDMPTLILFDAVKDSNEFPQIDRRLEEIELAEQEMELERERMLTFEELECSGNLILRNWLEID